MKKYNAIKRVKDRLDELMEVENYKENIVRYTNGWLNTLVSSKK